MSSTALWVGGAAVAAAGVIGLAVYLSRKKEVPQAITLPSQDIQGHRYRATVTAPAAALAALKIDLSSTASLQAAIDNNKTPVKVVSVSKTETAGKVTVIVVLDYTGPTVSETIPAAVQQKAAAQGITIKVEDLGPYKQLGVAAYPGRPLRAGGNLLVHRLLFTAR